jgi:Sulfotransferase domain
MTGPVPLDRSDSLRETNPRVSFIGIGAQKCASTWLHDVLAQHPDLCMPAGTKEVDFFSYHYDFGFQWYEQRFDKDASRLAGEISPSYLHAPGAAERVARYNPDMRIILIVREPVSRALSNHRHEVRIGHFRGADLSFEAGLCNNPSYIEQGLYAKHLRRWMEIFPRRNILVLRFDDVFERPADVMEDLCRFLSIADLPPQVDLFSKSNESYLVRNAVMEHAKNAARSALRSLKLGKAWEWLGNSGLRTRYRRANRIAPEKAVGTPLPRTIHELKSVFRPDIDELEQLTGLRFDAWR